MMLGMVKGMARRGEGVNSQGHLDHPDVPEMNLDYSPQEPKLGLPLAR
jgi:hypothetical protein